MADVNVMENSVEAFVAPKSHVGQTVVFWPTGARIGREPQTGRIIRVMGGGRTVVIETFGGFTYSSVRHIDDPKLAQVEQRANGAWEHTDDHRFNVEFQAETTKRLSELERQIAQLTADKLKEAKK